MTGPQLRHSRLATGVTAMAVAREMGISPSTICHLEQRQTVLPRSEARYLAALTRAATADQARRRQHAAALVQAGLDAMEMAR